MAKIGFDFYQHKYIAGDNISYKSAASLPVFLSLGNSSFSRKVTEFALLLIVWWRVYITENNPDSPLDNILKFWGFFELHLGFCKEKLAAVNCSMSLINVESKP